MGWLRAFFLPVSLALIVAAALIVPLPIFLEIPGQPMSLADRVDVDVADQEPLDGDYLLMSVRLPRGTVAGLARALVDDSISVVSPQRIVPPGVTDEEYFEQQRHVLRTTGEFAAGLGLARAGLIEGSPEVVGDGLEVVDVIPDTPADGVLAPGDVIVEADDQTIVTPEELQELVARAGTADPVALRILRDDEEQTVELVPASVELEAGEERTLIGVHLRLRDPRVDLPVPVVLDTGRVGGPSAGLMIALIVYDRVAPDEDLAGGRVVAGTGHLDPDGTVRSVGGVRQKVIAAHRFGADLFLAPQGQLADARDALPAGSSLQVVGVATLDEAVDVLLATRSATRQRLTVASL